MVWAFLMCKNLVCRSHKVDLHRVGLRLCGEGPAETNFIP